MVRTRDEMKNLIVLLLRVQGLFNLGNSSVTSAGKAWSRTTIAAKGDLHGHVVKPIGA